MKHFDNRTKDRVVGAYRLLVIDGHESHESQVFKNYCEEHNIITLCVPVHSSHILQPLDVGCFSPLKQSYGRVILGLARNGILHVDKMTYLPAFREAINASITEQNIRRSFRGAGLVPFNPEAVLSNLTVPIRTPTPPTTNNPAWEPKTPSNTVEFGSQSKLVSTKLGGSPSSHKDGIDQLVKGAHKMAHQVELMRDWIASLEKTVGGNKAEIA